jgi:aldehyde:ferredoxin oxidoreductase
VDTYGLTHKAEILKGEQDYLAGLDALVKCDFGAFGVTPRKLCPHVQCRHGPIRRQPVLEYPGGAHLEPDPAFQSARRAHGRTGSPANADRLGALPSGPHKGRRISEADMAVMLTEYYRERGWDAKGRPTEDRCEALGLNRKRQFDCGLPPSPKND